MGNLPVGMVVGVGGFVIGLVFGAVAQRTNFCTMGAVSDLILIGDGRRFRAWILAVAVAILGVQGLHGAGAIDIGKSIYLTSNLGWLGGVIGGLMFGFGMTQTGGCGGKTLIRLGAGNLKSLVVALVLGIFAYMTLRGLLAIPRTALENATNVDLAKRGLTGQGMGDILGATVGMSPSAARAAIAFAAGAAFLIYCFKDAAFRKSTENIVAGLVTGLASVAGWVVTGILGADEFEPMPLVSLTFVAPVGESIQYLMTFTGSTLNFGIAAVGGTIAGSFLAAKASGTFRIESFADRSDVLRHLGGGALMGAGGVLALGCTIGQGITGMSTLALGSLIAWLSILAGGYLGVKYLEEGSLSGAIRAAFARN